MSETYGNFDKYMDDILKREQEAKDRHEAYVESHEDNPQLERNKLYTERPQNRTYMVPLLPINKWGE